MPGDFGPEFANRDPPVAGAVDPDDFGGSGRIRKTDAPDGIEGFGGERVAHVAQNGGVGGATRDPVFGEPGEALEGAALVAGGFGWGEVAELDERE